MRQASSVETGTDRGTTRGALAALGMTLAWLAGCGSSATGTTPAVPDQPVPPDEPRAELGLTVDLPPAQDCEEVFDLALYQDRGIEIIEWDQRKGYCEDRTIRVRYLSRKLSPAQVRQAARAHASRVDDAPPRAPAAPPVAPPAPPPSDSAPPAPKKPSP